MAKWANSNVLDSGPEYIRTLAGTTDRVKQHLIKAYSAGDSYATVVGNSVASVSMATGDLTMGSSGSNRTMTVAAKSGVSVTADSGAGPNNHLALVDSTGSAVLLVTDETSDQQTYNGNTVNLPSWVYTVAQPT